jgi:hypothetical protein
MSSVRFVASLTTWFNAPFTSGFEVLSRASCFLTASSCGSYNYLFASAHVTHPHRFPHYFPDAPFLSALNDTSLRYSVELREITSGAVTVRAHLPLNSRPTRHSVRDVACLRLSLQQHGGLLETTLRDLSAMELAERRPPLRAQLRAEGHFLLSATESSTGDDASLLRPRSIHGTLIARSSAQTFLKTEHVLERGMCGGPVLDASGAVCGLVEGIVPLQKRQGDDDDDDNDDDHARGSNKEIQTRAIELLGGTAVIVESDALREVLEMTTS